MIIPVPIRYADFDALNHINHLSYIRYLEEARRQFYETAFGIIKPDEYIFILLNIQCDYLKEIKTFKDLIVYLRVAEIHTKKFILEYEIRDKSKFVYLKGSTTHGYYNGKEIVPLPKDIIDELDKHIQY